MDYRRALIAALLAASSGVACAGYAWPSDPSGFTRSGAWGNGYGYSAGANDSTFGKIIYQQNGLKIQVGGRTVTMPVAYRLAQNAPRFAAAAIFAHPGVRVAAGISAWLGVAGIIWDEVNKRWVDGTDQVVSSGFEYSVWRRDNWQSTKDKACQAYNPNPSVFNSGVYALYSGSDSCYYSYKSNPSQGIFETLVQRPAPCPAGWYVTPAGCSQTPPPQVLDEESFKDLLEPKPMPETVPLELPFPSPLPVEPTPGPWINPEPGTNPQHRPMFVPTGDPVPNPNYDPNSAPGPNNQPYIQPGTKLNPSPTVNDPFRLDVKPVDRPADSKNPMPGPESEESNNPNDKPREEKSDLCQDHPDIVACQKLGDLTPENLAKNTVTLQFEKSSGFGPENGSCPAPKEFMVLGKQMAFRWDLLCDFASGIRPLLIGFAYLSAALAFLGLSRKDS